VVGAQVRCVDAARDAVRAAVRGESAGVVRQAALQAGPAGARLAVSYQGDRVTVTVSAEVRVLSRLVPTIAVEAHAVGRMEPGVATDDGGG
jgi:hypothetical protein